MPGDRGLALLVVNPTAGSRRPRRLASAATEHLGDRGWRVRAVTTEYPGHARDIVRDADPEPERIVVVGGDGTLREAAEGLRDRRLEVPIGLVPLGNANVVAREWHIPQRPESAIPLLSTGVARRMDAGRANDRTFLAMVGVGFEAIVTTGVGWVRRTRLGRLLYRRGAADVIYGLVALPALLRWLPRGFEVIVDDEPLPRPYGSVTVCNTETYARGWAMAPGARPDDGRLEHQACARAAAPLTPLVLLAAIARRRVPDWMSDYGGGRSYRIRAPGPFRWQADGDPMPPTSELTIDIDPAAITILTPPDPRR